MGIDVKRILNQTTFGELEVGDLFYFAGDENPLLYMKIEPVTTVRNSSCVSAVRVMNGILIKPTDHAEVIVPTKAELLWS